MVTHFKKKTPTESLLTIERGEPGSWTHVESASPEEFLDLVKAEGLEATIIEDIRDFFEVPRFEVEEGKAYFFTRYPYDVKDHDIDTAPILFILDDERIITVAEQEVPFLAHFIEGRRRFTTTDSNRLFLEFLTELMVAYNRKLTRTRKLVYRDMGRVRSMRGKDLQRLVFTEQELNETLSALVPTYQWFNTLTKGGHRVFQEDDKELLEDLLIDCLQLIDSAKSILKTIQNIRNASEAMLTQSLNNTIRTLTAVTVVLTIPTLISSLFGMNVPNPLEEVSYAFWAISALIVTIMLVVVHLFSKNRWM